MQRARHFGSAPRETEDSAVVSREQPEWCTLGWVRSACSTPCPCLWVAHECWGYWYKTAVAFLAVRIIGQKTEQNVPGSRSFVSLFGMCLGWDMLPSQRMGILPLLSVLHLLFKFYLQCQQHKCNLKLYLKWPQSVSSKVGLLFWSIILLSTFKVHIHINISYCKISVFCY